MTCSVVVDEVHVRLGGKPVLTGMSLAVREAEVVAVLGRSGCGKSTLLNLIAGLVTPVAGRVAVEPAGAAIGCVFQQPRLLPWRTALRNVEFGMEQRRGVEGRRERARAALALVGLAGAEAALPHELSGGMQQRVALARALAVEPDALLLDEPFSAVDALTRADLQEELAAIVRAKRPSTVLVTHDIDEALLLADRVAVMSPAPARMLRVVDVPFGDERTLERIVGDPRYPQMRSELRGLLSGG